MLGGQNTMKWASESFKNDDTPLLVTLTISVLERFQRNFYMQFGEDFAGLHFYSIDFLEVSSLGVSV